MRGGFFRKSPQQKWDRQIWMNRTYGHDPETLEIADRMEVCPNNPRLGGGGFRSSETSQGDRRPADWIESWRELSAG